MNFCLCIYKLSLITKERFIAAHDVLNVLLTKQITVGYGKFSLFKPTFPWMYPPVLFRGVRTENRISIPDAYFSEEEDPTRLVCSVVSITQAQAIHIATWREECILTTACSAHC